MEIQRKHYLDELIRHKDNGRVKIITGIRRCGKSFLLFELYRNYLLSSGIHEDQIIELVLDEIQKTEERITEWQEHLRELNIRKKQLEDAEIIKSIRSMKLNSRELLVVLDKIQNGTAVFPYLTEETTVPDTKKEEDWKDIAEERKLPGHRAEEKEDEHRENEN